MKLLVWTVPSFALVAFGMSYFLGVFNASNQDQQIPKQVVVNAPALASDVPQAISSQPAPETSANLALTSIRNTDESSNQNATNRQKTVDGEQRDSTWANPTERDLRNQALKIPAIDDRSIVTRCASSVCDLVVQASRYASPDQITAFSKYVKSEELPISLANTNAMVGDVQVKNLDNRLTAMVTLDRIHR